MRYEYYKDVVDAPKTTPQVDKGGRITTTSNTHLPTHTTEVEEKITVRKSYTWIYILVVVVIVVVIIAGWLLTHSAG